MKKFFLPFICLLSFYSTAQDLKVSTSDLKRDSPFAFEIMLRGKAFAGAFFEDELFYVASTGVEFRFFESFSLVADLAFVRFTHEEEVYSSLPSTEYVEYAQRDSRNTMVLELRKYFKFSNYVQHGDLVPYLNVHSKLGNRRWRTEENFPITNGEDYVINSKITDIGPSIGFEFGSRLSVDVNIGASYRFESGYRDIYQNNETIYTPFENNRWKPEVRASVFWNFMGEGY